MSEPTTSPTGAIHDIGYRHYDGPRLGAAYIRRSLFVDTLRGPSAWAARRGRR
ncbi:hypothetical protein [Nocardioides euryhalodurans]|uniref:hypothetical protein n=1 Tax=Nocardioides euryhalodurans TaxID=2518370 RepID=UPI001ABE3E4D|nr:hypothetical protein [Nocardioides euryhalodurans]